MLAIAELRGAYGRRIAKACRRSRVTRQVPQSPARFRDSRAPLICLQESSHVLGSGQCLRDTQCCIGTTCDIGPRAISAQVLCQIGMVSTNAWTTLNFPTQNALAHSPPSTVMIFLPHNRRSYRNTALSILGSFGKSTPPPLKT